MECEEHSVEKKKKSVSLTSSSLTLLTRVLEQRCCLFPLFVDLLGFDKPVLVLGIENEFDVSRNPLVWSWGYHDQLDDEYMIIHRIRMAGNERACVKVVAKVAEKMGAKEGEMMDEMVGEIVDEMTDEMMVSKEVVMELWMLCLMAHVTRLVMSKVVVERFLIVNYVNYSNWRRSLERERFVILWNQLMKEIHVFVRKVVHRSTKTLKESMICSMGKTPNVHCFVGSNLKIWKLQSVSHLHVC